MASLRDIRKRIKSVKNSQKITKAMKMVAAAKLRRAQERVEAARPYADRVDATVAALARRAEALGEAPHPLLRPGLKGGAVELIVLTSNRGLCGGFNANTVRRARRFLFDEKAKHEKILVSTIGKKGYEMLRRDVEIHHNHTGVLETGSFARVSEIAAETCERFVTSGHDGVFLLYNEFRGNLALKQLLPIVPTVTTHDVVDYLYEPSRDVLLESLLPTHVATQLFRAALESTAAEHFARMMAMESATQNAKDVVNRLTLVYNRARQAAITKELMEIIGGAEALK